MLDAHQLNVFIVAAETLNFTEAGRRLNMTQPSVSQHIQALEQHFGADLFLRSGRHLRLTDAGVELLPMARQMVSLSVRIDETMNSLEGEVYGHLQVGCSTTSGKYVLPFFLADFLRRHPRVQATCSVTSRLMAVQELCEGGVHLALASPTEFANREIEFRKLFVDPIVLIVPLNHRWAQVQAVKPAELRTADLIMREEGSGTRDAVQKALAEAGMSLSDLQVKLTLGNSEAIALAVQEGLGVGFVSQFVVHRLVYGKVKVVEIAGLHMQQEVFVGYNTRRPSTTAQEAFWRFLTDPENPVLRKLSELNLQETPHAEAWYQTGAEHARLHSN